MVDNKLALVNDDGSFKYEPTNKYIKSLVQMGAVTSTNEVNTAQVDSNGSFTIDMDYSVNIVEGDAYSPPKFIGNSAETLVLFKTNPTYWNFGDDISQHDSSFSSSRLCRIMYIDGSYHVFWIDTDDTSNKLSGRLSTLENLVNTDNYGYVKPDGSFIIATRFGLNIVRDNGITLTSISIDDTNGGFGTAVFFDTPSDKVTWPNGVVVHGTGSKESGSIASILKILGTYHVIWGGGSSEATPEMSATLDDLLNRRLSIPSGIKVRTTDYPQALVVNNKAYSDSGGTLLDGTIQVKSMIQTGSEPYMGISATADYKTLSVNYSSSLFGYDGLSELQKDGGILLYAASGEKMSSDIAGSLINLAGLLEKSGQFVVYNSYSVTLKQAVLLLKFIGNPVDPTSSRVETYTEFMNTSMINPSITLKKEDIINAGFDRSMEVLTPEQVTELVAGL